MNSILEIPELVALDGPSGLIRIPQQIDVPVTARVLRLIDTPEFQRLKQISQLGLVSFVYPAANHNRFEHSLGVYRMALLFLRQLAHQPRFVEHVSPRDATLLMLAGLLHDIGHWPFCHPIEDLNLNGVPNHEQFGRQFISGKNITACLTEDWGVEPAELLTLINKDHSSISKKILSSILSGPIDIDKMDYLYRDSLHAGVPYGQNFDTPRLIRSLTLNQANDRLAISQKGKTAAELMVFARYVMFSEVYWHPAVRSATAMFQRAFFLWHQQYGDQTGFAERLLDMFQMNETDLVATLRADAVFEKSTALNASENPHAIVTLLDHLFGSQRRLYKRVRNFSCFENETMYRQIAQRPYPWIVDCSRQLATAISAASGQPIGPHQVLIDSPPVGLEVQFDVQVHFEKENRFVDLGAVSPVVQTLARRQFDDFVKQVRVFVAPEIKSIVAGLPLDDLIKVAIEKMSP